MTRKIIFALTITLLSNIASALPSKNYDVQVLVFSHLTPETLQSQRWSAIAPNIQTISAQPTNAATDLAHEKEVIERNPNYHVLVDGSWPEHWSGIQPTVSIPLSGQAANEKLSGMLSITLSQYFDVRANLFLTASTDFLKHIDKNGYFDQITQPTFSFQLSQNRRMRSNELNYFEHPVMGMIIKIVPMK